MSEYQYYEFRAIERPLSTQDRADLRGISSRATITASSFVNEYNYGSFKGDPDAMMDRWFDAHVYVANWGTRRLMLRVPRGSIDLDLASEYADDEALTIRANKDHVIFDFKANFDSPDDEWEEGEDWMSSLVTLRSELMSGDLRALYVGWLGSIYGADEEDAERVEPPLPPGMADPSPALLTLSEFLWIEPDLLEVAMAGSEAEIDASSRDQVEDWVKHLPASEKDAYLTRLIVDSEPAAIRAEIMRKYREAHRPKGRPKFELEENRRTIGDLAEGRDALLSAEIFEIQRVVEDQRLYFERQAAEARVSKLEQLGKNETNAWKDVSRLIDERTPRSYDEAVQLITDLLEIATQSGRRAEAMARIRDLRKSHAKKTSFLTRLRKLNLPLS